MMDEVSREPMLFEAWELLKPEERPEHLSIRPTWRTGVNWFMDDAVSDGGPVVISRWSARDRLIVAVEDVLLSRCGMAHMRLDVHSWGWYENDDEWHELASDPDRLAAAVAALRLQRVPE